MNSGIPHHLTVQYGPNELDKEEGTPLWRLVLAQFDDLLVKILLGAATLSLVRLFIPSTFFISIKYPVGVELYSDPPASDIAATSCGIACRFLRHLRTPKRACMHLLSPS